MTRLLTLIVSYSLSFRLIDGFTQQSSRVQDPMLRQAVPDMTTIDFSNIPANPPPILNNLLDEFDMQDHPIPTIIGSYLLAIACDMIPFVPCQPLAIALGAKLGFAYAFPVATAGQTTAGLLAFVVARQAKSGKVVQNYLEKLDNQALEKFQRLQQMTTSESAEDDRKILLALAGLRVAPFFPFSAGNYLLGGATAVPLRLFAIATLFGCIASNFLSTSIGAGGAALFGKMGEM